MAYIVHSYGNKPIIEEEHEHQSGIATEDRTLARVVEEVTRNYTKPCLITWFTMYGTLEYHYVRKDISNSDISNSNKSE
jgi:hypothetical protein